MVPETKVEAARDADRAFTDLDGSGYVNFTEGVDEVSEPGRSRGRGPLCRLEAARGLELLDFMDDVHDDKVDKDADVRFIVPTEYSITSVERVR